MLPRSALATTLRMAGSGDWRQASVNAMDAVHFDQHEAEEGESFEWVEGGML
jgi:hypothetical protein